MTQPKDARPSDGMKNGKGVTCTHLWHAPRKTPVGNVTRKVSFDGHYQDCYIMIIIAHLVLFQKTNLKFIFFPVFAYQYRSNKRMIGSHLGSFTSLDEVITYCNSHSNCYGIMDDGCDGGYYYARGYGSLLTPTYSPSCSWVMKLNY